MITVKAAEGGWVTIGRRGENGRTTVIFDVSEYLTEYSGATVSLIARRPGDAVAYPVQDGVSESGGIVSWVVSNIDTGVVGIGSATVNLKKNDVVVKSISYGTRILYADALENIAPSPLDGWQAIIKQAAAVAVEAAESVTPSTDEDVAWIISD